MSKIEVIKRGRSVRVHPKLAEVLVSRGGYLRRDMVAQDAPGQLAPPAAPQAPAAPPVPVVELDSTGAAWDPSLHTADKAKTKAGAWRKRPQPKQSSPSE